MYSYALIDTTPIEGWYLKLQTRGIGYCSLFADKPEEAFLEIAPLLIALDGLTQHNGEWLTKELTRQGQKHPAVHWLQSPHAIAELAMQLQNFHTVGLADGKILLLRWYDTRILPEWFEILNDGQRKQFMAGISQWKYIDRYGDSKKLPCNIPNETQIAQQVNFEFNDEQTKKIRNIGQTDALIAQIKNVLPDELQKIKLKILYPFVDKCREDAVRLGLLQLDQQTVYALMALHTSGNFEQVSAVQELLRTLPEHAGQFTNSVESLPDMVWQSGKPLWM